MDIIEIIQKTITNKCLNKIVLSKPKDKKILKSVVSVHSSKEDYLQEETFTSDGKAFHTNYEISQIDEIISGALNSYRQIDVLTNNGSCTVMISKNGQIHIANKIKDVTNDSFNYAKDSKTYILSDKSSVPFLTALGICSSDGRVFDKKQSKYKQINRFLEIVDDVYPSLPTEGELQICDFCCGKSYLTFAVYWFLTKIKNRDVSMYGVDLKGDVIDYCTKASQQLGYTGMHFYNQNALDFVPPHDLDMAISLHACDIATDIVLSKAVIHNAKVILSTPCCHHEMFNQINCEPLSFITKHSILKQKLCDAATDSIRCMLLEMENYSVTAMELIDPDETPKNVLIKATKRKNALSNKKLEALKQEYSNTKQLLGVNPKLESLLIQQRNK